MTEKLIPVARPQLGAEEEAAVLEAMRSGELAQGARVHSFEQAFAEAVGARFAIATSNGTTAIFLALMGSGVGPGDEVITTPLTFIASANAIVHAGARPVFGDVDESLNLDLAGVESLIGPRTKAIMPVHLHGNPFDAEAFEALAARHGIAFIQDACQAIGATVRDRPLGAFGTACYSLYATKNITTGEGGMITTDDAEVARFCATMRHQAYTPGASYMHSAVGYNFRMTEIEAAIGICQLRKLEDVTEARRFNASYFDAGIDRDRFPRPAANAGHVYHQYVLRVGPSSGLTRPEVVAQLQQAGIATAVHYPVPVHLQPAYSGDGSARLPISELAASEILSIPVHPAIDDSDRQRIADAFRNL